MRPRLLILIFFSLTLCSCSTLGTDMGFVHLSDMQQREGITGTPQNPATLDPFKRYDLVMAANECRYLQMNLPQRWYWKIFVTGANRAENDKSKLTARLLPSVPDWVALPISVTQKEFELNREGVESVLGVANTGPARMAVLELCQEGSPVRVTIQSEVSPMNEQLMQPFGMKPDDPLHSPQSAGE